MKNVKNSLVIMNELVLPNDTNFLGKLMGGKLTYWMDIAAAMSAMKHSNTICVTASIDNLSFKKQIDLGTVVRIEAFVTRTFNTSLEVIIQAWNEDYTTNLKTKSHTAFFTFVALDKQTKKPIPVAPIIPESEEEKQLYEEALDRRKLRLFLDGKAKLEENFLSTIENKFKK